MYVRQVPLGPMKNFVYLLGPDGDPRTAVVDPAWDVGGILDAVAADGRTLAAIILTHSHHDHVNGVSGVLAACDVPVYLQRAELEVAEVAREWNDAVRPVGPGDVVELGGLAITCVHTPGHTPGAQCLWCGGALVSGDTLFVNACGRCDLPGGDVDAMYHSLHHVLGRLDGATTLYPGHDYGDVPVSTLARERAHNPYLVRTDHADFVRYRTRPR